MKNINISKYFSSLRMLALALVLSSPLVAWANDNSVQARIVAPLGKGTWNAYAEYHAPFVWKDWPGAVAEDTLRLQVSYTPKP